MNLDAHSQRRPLPRRIAGRTKKELFDTHDAVRANLRYRRTPAQPAPQVPASAQATKPARLIAFHLPQFHPIPENDTWWGAGFTEWRNVATARPLFRGHDQPRIPADLGFYDLRLAETREAQAALASAYGIEGFCYWHYWFHGHRLLEQPVEEILRTGEPEAPFCLSWANESWTRTWLGRGEVLLEQHYSEADDLAHARWLIRAFADDRYINVRGRPLFLVYRPVDHPRPQRFTELLRRLSTAAGLAEPYLLGVNGWGPWFDCRRLGFDGTVDFEPQLGDLPFVTTDRFWPPRLVANLSRGVFSGRLKIYDYRFARQRMMRRRQRLPFEIHPTVLVGWDNTARRRKRATVMTGATPDAFRDALVETIGLVEDKPEADRLVFINAWNEWAEGNYLEPDLRFGHKRLEAVRDALQLSMVRTVTRSA